MPWRVLGNEEFLIFKHIYKYIGGEIKLANEKIIKRKEEEVKELAAKMKDASLVLLVDYRGINVADVTELRKSVREIYA